MRQALAQAEIALSLAEVPVGAVAVFQGEIVGAGYNRKESDQDPTRHAEIIAMQEAARTLGNWRLLDVTLYCTLEPCPMCGGAMIQARLPRLVYGAKDIRFGADGSLLELFAIEEFNHRVEVTAGVLADEAATLLQDFFRQLRFSRSV
ncbi:MAG: tRNA adenosine(34) deaminase TadA [Anaerolineales bacterium]|nr:tRNA adenosine(34) deaminase TadA [Anaerolineales bacterium]